MSAVLTADSREKTVTGIRSSTLSATNDNYSKEFYNITVNNSTIQPAIPATTGTDSSFYRRQISIIWLMNLDITLILENMNHYSGWTSLLEILAITIAAASSGKTIQQILIPNSTCNINVQPLGDVCVNCEMSGRMLEGGEGGREASTKRHARHHGGGTHPHQAP